MTEINLAVIFSQSSVLLLLVLCGCLPSLLHAGLKRFRSNMILDEENRYGQ